MRIELRVDPDELPRGHSTVKQFEDDSCYISFGGGQAGYDPPRAVVNVDFKRLGLYVTGGKSMTDFIRSKDRSLWPNAALEYTFAWVLKSGDAGKLVTDLLEQARKIGYKDGVQDAQQRMREALGLGDY